MESTILEPPLVPNVVNVEITETNDSNKRKMEEPQTKQKRVKRPSDKPKKYVLLISYIGTNYQGIQVNPGNKTIEGDLLTALDTIGAIKTKNTKDKHNLEWHRACRTDKGVHAARNIITAKLLPALAEKEDFVSLLNSTLSPDIRVQTIQRVENYFNPKNYCKRRTYLYFMPTWVLSTTQSKLEKEDWNRLNLVLSKYLGTHPFHNFTTKMLPTDPSVCRHILKCEASQPMNFEDKEYVLITVYGNSFMLHQIRKMMGLAISIMRGKCDISIFESVYDKKYFVKTPEAPGHCLVLDRPEFSGYNRQQESNNFFRPLTFEGQEEQIEALKSMFKQNFPIFRNQSKGKHDATSI
jgi:tRNA pseudouridine38-40 synthase